MYKRRKACCPDGHFLQQVKTQVKLESFFQQFPSNFKIHVPSSIVCSRCNSNIYADQQPTFATCTQCNFHLCRSCIASSSPVSSMGYAEEDYCSRKRKGRFMDDNAMSCDEHYDDPNAIKLSIRYNNTRPNYTQYSRVPYYLYPEPSNFGWKFTGSDVTTGRTEFFEREIENGLVLLDFDFMTGTVRTVLVHRMKGSTQLFGKGKSLLPDVYVKILQNPCFSDSRFQRRLS